ncbi:MAG: hypothetical protein R2704_12855 [Microthrixaceae bacterium]
MLDDVRRPVRGMASANDLVVLFIGLEILSLAAYTLAGPCTVGRAGSLEAA